MWAVQLEKRLSDRYKVHERHWFVDAKPPHARDFSHVRLHDIDWFINHYPELEQIREFMETLPYSFGFQFLYSKKSGELFYRSCYKDEMRLIWRIGE